MSRGNSPFFPLDFPKNIVVLSINDSMAAKDLFHEQVRSALEKAGWEITHDPYQIFYEGVRVAIDLGARTLIGAELEGAKIAVEIKSFLSGSFMYDFHAALGQYINYRRLLAKTEDYRKLYLAVPLDTFQEYFSQGFYQETIQAENLYVLVFDPASSTIVSWNP